MHDFPDPDETERVPEWVSWLTVWLCAAVALDMVVALAVTDFGKASAIAEGIMWMSLGTVMLVAVFCHAAAFGVATYGLIRWRRRRHRLPIVRMVISVVGVCALLGLFLLS